jgi:hypothetical protein
MSPPGRPKGEYRSAQREGTPVNLLPMKSVRWPRSGTVGDTPPELTRKSDICAKVLAEARKLALAGQFGTLPNQLAVRAGELLDDMDEILVALDPARNRASFALAAALHRELEQIQATLTDLRKRRGASRNAPSER